MWIGLKTVATIEMNKFIEEKQKAHKCLILKENVHNYGIFGKQVNYVEFSKDEIIFITYTIGK